MSNLKTYRENPIEQQRIKSLMDLLPKNGATILDVGARDGYISIALTSFFEFVTAIDLKEPCILNEKVSCMKGDITSLNFPDNSFDVVLCAEVLEHIQPNFLEKACQELTRVTKRFLLIGVPYKEDTRVGRTTCYNCGKKNPQWAHINKFDENILKNLFKNLTCEKIEYVSENNSKTNFISTFFMDLGGNIYGTYLQEEPCIYCGNKLKAPIKINPLKKIITKLAIYLNRIQANFISTNPNWIHILFRKT
ncbi:MAG: class I SAM-dependent methyltransferase [Desulfobacterales bacterium]|nr:class I SAM-dependent methyltransferase [Desulfobacterales bacterium]